MKREELNGELLVIVDMSNEFVYGTLGTKEAQAIVDPIAEYADNFEGDKAMTADTHEADYLETQEGKNLPVIHGQRGTYGWEIVDALQHIKNSEGTAFFCKNTFGSLELAEYIKKKKYKKVVFCGADTGICVLSCIVTVKTVNPEVEVAVLKDLCACVTPQTHNTAIEALRLLQVTIV